MGNTKKIAGWILIGFGTFLVILGGVFIALALTAEDMESELARGTDFNMEYDRSYTYQVDSDDATSLISIEVLSTQSRSIELYVRIADPTGTNILNRKVTTPITLEVDVLGDFSDHWIIKLIFIEDGDTINDVNVKVYGETTSNTAAGLCCAGGIVPVIGIILVIVGIILVVVGSKNEKNDLRAWNNTIDNGGPPGYPQRSSDPNRTRSLNSSGYPGPNPDPYQNQGSYDHNPSPRTYPPPPIQSYQPPAQQRDPSDTRDGIRIGYLEK